MAKLVPDAILDAALNVITDIDRLDLCSTQPTTFTEARTTYTLAKVTVDGGDWTDANGDTSGRKSTMGAQTGVTINNAGTTGHVAGTLTAGSVLKFVTTTNAVALSTPGTVDIGVFDIELGDAT